jgi:hypothetical protein
MSIDQKPTSPEEQKRLASLGGTVVYSMGVARVNGVLAVSRAFGNRSLRHVIRPDLELQQRELCRDDDFLVMASDGLWDVLKNRDVCDICYTLIHLFNKQGTSQGQGQAQAQGQGSSGPSCQQLAEELVGQALARGSMDNVTCIVVRLQGYIQRLYEGGRQGQGQGQGEKRTAGTTNTRGDKDSKDSKEREKVVSPPTITGATSIMNGSNNSNINTSTNGKTAGYSNSSSQSQAIFGAGRVTPSPSPMQGGLFAPSLSPSLSQGLFAPSLSPAGGMMLSGPSSAGAGTAGTGTSAGRITPSPSPSQFSLHHPFSSASQNENDPYSPQATRFQSSLSPFRIPTGSGGSGRAANETTGNGSNDISNSSGNKGSGGGSSGGEVIKGHKLRRSSSHGKSKSSSNSNSNSNSNGNSNSNSNRGTPNNDFGATISNSSSGGSGGNSYGYGKGGVSSSSADVGGTLLPPTNSHGASSYSDSNSYNASPPPLIFTQSIGMSPSPSPSLQQQMQMQGQQPAR